MAESKVGRMGSSFYTLYADDQQLAYLWQRALFRDMPTVPNLQRLELFETHNEDLWAAMFADCPTLGTRLARFQEYVHDGEITLRRLRRSPTGRMSMVVYDGSQITIAAPSTDVGLFIGGAYPFPKSMTWSHIGAGTVVTEVAS